MNWLAGRSSPTSTPRVSDGWGAGRMGSSSLEQDFMQTKPNKKKAKSKKRKAKKDEGADGTV